MALVLGFNIGLFLLPLVGGYDCRLLPQSVIKNDSPNQTVVNVPNYLHLPFSRLLCIPDGEGTKSTDRVIEMGVKDRQLIIDFDGKINGSNSIKLIDIFIDHVRDPSIDTILLRLNTEGGDVEIGMRLAQLIASYPKTVTCYVDEYSASMGFYILQACPFREMAPDAILLTHEPFSVIPESSLNKYELKERLDSLEEMSNSMADFIAKRMYMKVEDYVSKIKDADWKMDSEEALQVHAVDKIRNHYLIYPIDWSN